MHERSHLLVVRAVAKGMTPGPSPALRAAFEAGLVARAGDRWSVTPAGREALDAAETVPFRPTKTMIAAAVLIVILALLALFT